LSATHDEFSVKPSDDEAGAVQLSQKSIGFAYADDPMTLTGTALELESWKERMVEV
jgi:hypothetical protein